MLLFLLLPTIAGLISAMLISYNNISPKYKAEVENKLYISCENEGDILKEDFKQNEFMAEALGKHVISTLLNAPKENWTNIMNSYMISTLNVSPWLYTMWVAFENNTIWNTTSNNYDVEYMVLFGHNETNGEVTEPVYYTDYQNTLYYGIPKASNKSFTWTIPDYDPVYDFMYISATVPLYRNGTFIGVAACDVDLAYLQKRIMDITSTLGNGYAFLLFNEQGQILAHPVESFTFAKTSNQESFGQPGKLAPSLSNSTSDPKNELKAIIEEMMAGKSGIKTWNQNTVFFTQVGDVGMSLAFVYPQDQVNQPVNEMLTTTMIIIIIASIIVGGLIFYISVSITNPIKQLSENSRKIASGDLTQEIKENNRADEIGMLWNDFKELKEKLTTIISQSKTISQSLSAAAEELSSSAEEVSSSSENIASSQQQISKGASNQVNAITDTQKKISELNNGLKDVKEKIDSITMISEMIKNISTQTNMLALNAAIEAARAGEAGRGFNVVADQVRKLANESKTAVEKTESLLSAIMEITAQQEQRAVNILQAVDAIATVAEETSASTEESAAAAEEQASSMEMITQTSQDLLKYAEMMSAEYENFKLDSR